MVEADIAKNSGVNAAAVRAAFEKHGMTLPAPAVEMAIPVKRKTRGGSTQQLREELAVPAGTPLTFTPVQSDTQGEIAHVVAYRPVQLTDGDLAGVRLMVPAVAAVRTRGRSVTGVIGAVKPADQEVEREGRAFARALLANGDIRGTAATAAPATGRRTRGGGGKSIAPPPPRPAYAPFPPTHEVRIVAGEPTLARVGFSGRSRRP
jgi:hypothetical protein